MPMVRRGESHHVNVLVLQQLPNVGVAFHLLTALLAFAHCSVEHILVHVAQRHQPRPFDPAHPLNMVSAAPMKSDHRKADVAIRSHYPLRGRRLGFNCLPASQSRQQANRGGGVKRSFEKTAWSEAFDNTSRVT